VSCEGNACDVITVAWDAAAGGFCVHNLSDRAVLVVFTSWSLALEAVLGPHQIRFLLMSEFELPYRAEYADGPDSAGDGQEFR